MHAHEFVSDNGYKVRNPQTGVETEVINPDGTLNGGAVIDNGSITAAKLASDAVETAKIKNANVTLAKLATGIAPSHVIKFVALGSEITGTTLAGLAVDDLVIRVIVADGTVTAKLVTVADTLPDDPADGDYIIVLRAAA